LKAPRPYANIGLLISGKKELADLWKNSVCRRYFLLFPTFIKFLTAVEILLKRFGRHSDA
jgi:hypothetical protein